MVWLLVPKRGIVAVKTEDVKLQLFFATMYTVDDVRSVQNVIFEFMTFF